MDLILIVSLDGLEKQRVIKTRVGRRTNKDSEPVSLNETINWYTEFSEGDSGFREIQECSTLQKEADLNAQWARNVWEKPSYGISYHVVTQEEAKKLIQSHKTYEDSD